MDMSKGARAALLIIGSILVALSAAMSLCKGLDEGFSPTPGQHEGARR